MWANFQAESIDEASRTCYNNAASKTGYHIKTSRTCRDSAIWRTNLSLQQYFSAKKTLFRLIFSHKLLLKTMIFQAISHIGRARCSVLMATVFASNIKRLFVAVKGFFYSNGSCHHKGCLSSNRLAASERRQAEDWLPVATLSQKDMSCWRKR